MVFYSILSGKKPFSDIPTLSASSLFAKVKRGERPELREDIFPAWPQYIRRCWHTDIIKRLDFANICKKLRHFRNLLLQVNAYVGWEHERKGVIIPKSSRLDESDFMIGKIL